ncbi:DUF2637 domain-containing protein [Micromonospora sp. WMMA1923]|uniref:DUF2637 domain-containing protein n=1 Tax=Micromonospora sp. WMMA1923 TaxID=3404125 RepID=UPI003B93E805
MTAPASIYPRSVEELLPTARKLAAELGTIPSRNKLMGTLRIGAAKANELRDRLAREQVGEATGGDQDERATTTAEQTADPAGIGGDQTEEVHAVVAGAGGSWDYAEPIGPNPATDRHEQMRKHIDGKLDEAKQAGQLSRPGIHPDDPGGPETNPGTTDANPGTTEANPLGIALDDTTESDVEPDRSETPSIPMAPPGGLTEPTPGNNETTPADPGTAQPDAKQKRHRKWFRRRKRPQASPQIRMNGHPGTPPAAEPAPAAPAAEPTPPGNGPATAGELTSLLRIRWAVRAVLVLGVAASIAGNVLHARDELISQIISAWSPLALLLTIELISRVPVHRRHLAIARWAATTLIAGIAAWVSYWHMAAVSAHYGETNGAQYLLPLSVDGLVVVASISLVELGGRIAAGKAANDDLPKVCNTITNSRRPASSITPGPSNPSGSRRGDQPANDVVGQQSKADQTGRPAHENAPVKCSICRTAKAARRVTETSTKGEPIPSRRFRG